ncbi:MAG: DUF362 domain-containing protein [Firmicutes bacterium]|nr:DUF362 domain-containing protein [Bacillota bacterium]
MSQVYIARCAGYEREQVQRAVRRAVDALGGMRRYVRPGDNVLIKPNLLVASAPEAAVTTHPEVLRAAIELVQAAGGMVWVGDSPGFGNPIKVAEKSGLAEICRETGAVLRDFGEADEAGFADGVICKRFTLARPVREADVVISLAKLKTHGLTLYTGAMKNLFGCISGLNKSQMHLRFQQREDFAGMLVDLYSLVKPALSIVDGVVGMEGEGPRNGRPRPIGVILAGADAVAVDAVGATIIGLDPLAVPTTRIAHARGVGQGDPARIEMLGDPLAEAVVPDYKHSAAADPARRGWFARLAPLLREQLTARPFIHVDKCQGCGVCRNSCPPSAISIEAGKARIDETRCIRCYCCQELCPEGAVELRKSWLARRLVRA